MFGIRTRLLAATVLATLSSPMSLMAQWGMFNDCACSSPQQYVAAPAPVVTQSACLQPVTKMVAKQMQVTEYRQAQRVEKRPVQRVRTVSRAATAYRQVMDTKTVDVPATTYQTVTEMVPQTINKSRWQTVSQPVAKMAPCQYDSRPTMMGRMNRMGYQMRSSLQPNFVTHRQFIPQVCQVSVPVQKQVAVQTTRQVTYNVARMEPYQTTQQVAEYYTDYENVTVTTMEPATVTKTVHVAEVQWAMIDPLTGAAMVPQTRTAEEKQPTRAAENDDAPNGVAPKNISYPKPNQTAPSSDRSVIRKDASAETSQAVVKAVKRRAAPAVAAVESDGWKAHTPSKQEIAAPKLVMPKNSLVSK